MKLQLGSCLSSSLRIHLSSFVHATSTISRLPSAIIGWNQRISIDSIFCLATVFLFLLTPSIARSQSECGTIDQPDQLASLHVSLLTGNDGPYYIKFYPVIIRPNGGAGGVSIEEVMEQFDLMAEAFEAHNIFFHMACVSEIKNTNYYQLAGNIPDELDFEDGITGYLYDHSPSNGGFSGLANGIPGTRFWANIKGSPHLMTHEMGHVLGLNHTFNATGCSPPHNPLNELVNGTECTTRGDFVCDTYATPHPSEGGGSVDANCNYTSNPKCVDPSNQEYLDVDPKNIMYYSNCRDYLTAGQGERIRNTLANHAKLAPFQRNEFYIVANSASQPWVPTFTFDQNAPCDVDIIVDFYGRLHIDNATLSMAPGKKIVLKQGAYLDLDDAILTVGVSDGCKEQSPFWGGIEVVGGPDNQSPYNEAFIVGHNTRIEHAKSGIQLPAIDYSKPPMYHGRVSMFDCEFINNEISVDYWERPYYDNLAYSNVFSRCTFDLDQGFLGDDFRQHVLLINNKASTKLTDCYFAYNWNGAVSSNSPLGGIQIYGSTVYLTGNQTDTNFEGFKSAVLNYTSPGRGSDIHVEKIMFNDNIVAIDNLGSQSGMAVMSSIFYLPLDPVTSSYGILNESGPSFMIRDNEFRAASDQHSYGIFMLNPGRESNSIIGNRFDGLEYGIYLFGVNIAEADELEGTTFRCNTHTANNKADFYTVGENQAAQSHGYEENPSGNKFSFSPVLYSDYNNLTSQAVKYFFDNSEYSEAPQSMNNVVPWGFTNNPDCSSPIDNPFPDLEPIPDKEGRYTDLIADYDSAVVVLAGQTDSIEIVLTKAFMSDRHMRAVMTASEAVHWYLHSDSLDNITERRKWLERKLSFAGQIQAAATYLEENDSLGHVTYRDQIGGRMSLDAEQQQDLDLYTILTDLLLVAISQRRYEGAFTPVEVAIVDSIALSNDRFVARYAKNICTVFYNYSYSVPNSSMMQVIPEPSATAVEPELQVYPNPNRGIVTFDAPDGKLITKVKVYTSNGILVRSKTGLDHKINLNLVNEGIYFYAVTFADGSMKHGKIITLQ